MPERVTSPVSKPVTGSLNTTVKSMSPTFVGSSCVAAWSMVTVGPAGTNGLMGTAAITHMLELATVQLMVTELPAAGSVLAAPRALDA